MDSEKKEGKEFDWISNVSKDYWDHYDAVVFNKKLSKNEFTEFINQALKSTQPANASDWNDDDEMSDLEYLNYRIRREGQAFIGKYVDEKGRTVLVYGKDPDELYPEVKDAKAINYGDIKKGLDESDFKTSDNELRDIAKKYETKGEWKNSDESTYQQALRRGKDFYSDITSHMVPGKKGKDVKILTNDELRGIAKNFNSRGEWKKKSQSTWKRAKNRDKEIPGFYADITSHMDVLRKSLSDDELRDIAKKYETRTEWYRKSPNSYRQAIRRDKEIPGFYNDITSDMKRLEVSEKYIYAYEFYDGEKPIAAYIGLTCDMRRRSKEHETGFCRYGKSESTVTKYIKTNPKLKYKIVELEPYPLEGKEAKAKEKYWEELYRKEGWETLNVAKTGALGVTYIATNDELRDIAKKYKTRNEWKKSVDGNAYRSALRRGKKFYDDITSHMVSGKGRGGDGKFKNKQISESGDLDWIKDAYKTEWTFDDIAQLYYAGDVESVKVVGFKDLKHLNGALDWCAGSGDFKNNFKVGSVHQILSTNLDIDGEISHNEFTVSDLDCGWCLDDPDSIGYDCNERPKTMSLRFKPKDPDFFVFSEDWVKLEPIFISDDLNESSEDFDWAKDITAEFHKGMCLRRKDGTQWLVVDTPKYAQKGTTLVWLQRTHTNGVSITEKRRPVSPHRISTLNRLIQSGKLVICDEPLKESGDFDWVGDVPNTLPKDETWVLVNDVDPESEKVSVEIQNFLFQNQGFKWISGKDTAYHRPFLALSYHSEPKYSDSGIGYHDLSGYFDSEGNPNFEKRLKQFREDFGKGIYFWSDLKNNNINESKDDFDWVEDVVPNLFHGRDIKFYIDEIPTQEQSEYIWDMLVDAGVTDRDKVIRYDRVNKLMNSVGTFIFVDYDGGFLHNVQDLGGYIENGRISAGNIIKFSDIFPSDEPSDSNDLNTFIKESGDFDWVEDVPITLNNIFYKLEVGDELTLKGNTHGIHTSGDVTKFKYTEPFKITIQSTGPKLEDSTFKISVKEKEAIVNLGIKHKGELLKKYPNSHMFKDNSFFKEDGDLEVVSWVKSEDRIDESKNDFDWIEDVSGSLPKNNNWMLINDVDPKSLEVSKDIQDYLFSKGLKWNTGRGTPLYQPILAIHYVLPKLQKNGSFTYVPNSIPFEKSRLEVEYDREEYIKKGKQVYYWSQLKPKKEDVKESEDLKWIKDTELIDPKKPKPGYVYHWDGYSNFFGGENIKSDHIVIKKSEIDEGNMYYFFDTLDFFWGDEPDAVMKTEFNRRLNDGTITFSYKLSQ